VGCGIRAAKSGLIRLVAVGGEVVPDARGRLPGRGAYLHLSQDCLDRARRRQAFSRALRARGPVGTRRLAEFLAAAAGGERDEVPAAGTVRSIGRIR